MKRQFSDILKKGWDIPQFKVAEEAIQAFSFTERIIFYGLAIILTLASVSLLWKVNMAFIVEVPREGGTLIEGIVGTPRFINPLLAITDTDRDLSALIYSGLLKATPAGTLVPDLASDYSISDDGKTYTFTISNTAYFHDGHEVTADDVIFTITKAQDTALKSPKRANWEGVRAEKINHKKVQLVLKQPYAPFLENATMGILPEHIWKEVDAEQFPFSQYNIEPIGSGPYVVKKIERNAGGIPVSLELSAFRRHVTGRPFISTIAFKFFSNQSALLSSFRQGGIQSMNALPPTEVAKLEAEGVRVERGLLPRVFGVFFNQNQAPVLAHKEVRKALDIATDKERIVREVLSGYGTALQSPIPVGLLDGSLTHTNSYATEEERISSAVKVLEDAGWKRNPDTGIMEKTATKATETLTFSISTSNAPELKQTALLVEDMWKKIGANVEVKYFETGELNQSVIRPRKYDALLFGEIIGRDLDLFAFWHSSQRNDPGLNIALYVNQTTDKLLEDARSATSTAERLERYRTFEQEIVKDVPAVFTHSPDFLYMLPKEVKGFTVDTITVPSERFLGIETWYINTEKVWKIFVN